MLLLIAAASLFLAGFTWAWRDRRREEHFDWRFVGGVACVSATLVLLIVGAVAGWIGMANWALSAAGVVAVPRDQMEGFALILTGAGVLGAMVAYVALGLGLSLGRRARWRRRTVVAG